MLSRKTIHIVFEALALLFIPYFIHLAKKQQDIQDRYILYLFAIVTFIVDGGLLFSYFFVDAST